MFSPIIYIYIYFYKSFSLAWTRETEKYNSFSLSFQLCRSLLFRSSTECYQQIKQALFFRVFQTSTKSTLGRDARSTLASCSHKTHEEIGPVFQSVIGLLKQGQNVKLLDVSAEGGEQFVGWFPVRNAGNKVELDSLASQW